MIKELYLYLRCLSACHYFFEDTFIDQTFLKHYTILKQQGNLMEMHIQKKKAKTLWTKFCILGFPLNWVLVLK